MENRILIDDIIVLDRNLCQKIGIEQAFMLINFRSCEKRRKSNTKVFILGI